MYFVSQSCRYVVSTLWGQIFLCFCYFLEVKTLAGPFCFQSEISPCTALSKMDPTWTNLRTNSVVCNQMAVGSTMKYGGAWVVWLVVCLFAWLVFWLVGWLVSWVSWLGWFVDWFDWIGFV